MKRDITAHHDPTRRTDRLLRRGLSGSVPPRSGPTGVVAGPNRLAFVDVSGDDAPATLGPDLSREAAQARFHVRDDQGRLASGASGFIRLWRELPGWGWLAAFASLPGMPILAEAAYRGFLPLRPRLAKLFSRFSGTSCDTACRPPKA